MECRSCPVQVLGWPLWLLCCEYPKAPLACLSLEGDSCLPHGPIFCQPLQEILSILEKKGDAIAFERKKNPYDPVKYYDELPVEVRDRLSE